MGWLHLAPSLRKSWRKPLVYRDLRTRRITSAVELTGLRKNELASLTVAQVHLDEPTPYAELDAADEKNREGSSILIRDNLAEDLRRWLTTDGRLPNTPDDLAANAGIGNAGQALANDGNEGEGRVRIGSNRHRPDSMAGVWCSGPGVSARLLRSAREAPIIRTAVAGP